jgi:hypothetical protein
MDEELAAAPLEAKCTTARVTIAKLLQAAMRFLRRISISDLL